MGCSFFDGPVLDPKDKTRVRQKGSVPALPKLIGPPLENEGPVILPVSCCCSSDFPTYDPEREKQNYRANCRSEDCTRKASNVTHEIASEQPTTDDGSEDADRDIPEQAIAVTFYDHTCEPAGNAANDKPDYKGLGIHFSAPFENAQWSAPLKRRDHIIETPLVRICSGTPCSKVKLLPGR
jgi:hypothetical protein